MEAIVVGAAATILRRGGKTHAPILAYLVTRGTCGRVRPIISCRFTAVTVSDGRSPTGVSKRVDQRISVADRPLHLSRYGRLISGPGGLGTARRVVRPVLTSAETLSAIGVDQDVAAAEACG